MQVILRYETGPNAGLQVGLMSQAQLDQFDAGERAVVVTGITLACADVAAKQEAWEALGDKRPPNWRDTPMDFTFMGLQDAGANAIAIGWSRMVHYDPANDTTPILTPELLVSLGSTGDRFLALCAPIVNAVNDLVHRHWSQWVELERKLPSFSVSVYFGDPVDTVPPMGTT